MTIEYNVTEQDYLNFNLFHSTRSKHAKNAGLALRYGFAFLLLFMFFVLYRSSIPTLILGVVFTVAWIILFPKYYAVMIKRSVKKMISEGKNDFIGPQKLTLNDDCIEEVTQAGSSSVKYTAVEAICYGYGCMYIYIGAIKAYIVPVSAFSNDSQRSEFIHTLTEKAGIKYSGFL